MQAFGRLCAAGLDDETDWEQILNDPEPRVVAWAVRYAARGRTTAVKPLTKFAMWRRNQSIDPRVQFELILALGQLPSIEMNHPLRQLIEECWSTSWGLDAISVVADPKASLTLQTLLHVVEQNGSAIEDDHWNRIHQCVESLWKRCGPHARAAIVKNQLGKTSEQLTPAQWLTVLTAAPTYAREDNSDPTTASLLASVVERARDTLRDPNQTLEMRVRATKLIGCALIPSEQHLDDLRMMMRPDQPGAIRRAGLSAAYRVTSPETARVLIDAWDELLPDERAMAGATLLQRTPWILALIESLEQDRIDVDDLDASTISGLRNCQNYSIMKRFGTLSSAPSVTERKALVEHYIAKINTEEAADDTVAELAYRNHCAVCHEKRSADGQTLEAIGPPPQQSQALVDPPVGDRGARTKRQCGSQVQAIQSPYQVRPSVCRSRVRTE